MHSIYEWSHHFPTKEYDGKWFFVRREIKVGVFKIDFMEIRVDKITEELYLCQPCNGGIEKQSFGVKLKFYTTGSILFCGPIQMYPDYRQKSV